MASEYHEIGIVCGQCDTWSPMGAGRCAVCSNDLALFAGQRHSVTPPSTGAKSQRPSALAMMAMRQGTSVTKPAPAPAPPPSSAQKPPPRTAPRGSDLSHLSQEELMEQAKNYVCLSCSSGVPSGHKFCGRCGTAVPPEILNAQTLFFGDMQNPAKAKL